MKINFRIIILLSIFFNLIGCDSIGPKKVKSLTELTPNLSVNTNEPVKIDADKIFPLLDENMMKTVYTFAKNRVISEPTFAKGILYTIDNKAVVRAFSKKGKTTLWMQDISYKAKAAYSGGGILYSDGKLYITNGSKFLVVLDSRNGHEIMRKEFPDIIRVKPIMLSQNVVLIQTVSNQLFAYDLEHSSFVWQHEGMFETLSSHCHVNPIVYNGLIIVNYTSGQIFALDIKTGQERWMLNLSAQQEVSLPNFEALTLSCAPIVDGNDIYVASSTNKLIKLNMQNGAIIWQTKASDIQSISMNGNSLFITTNARELAAISKFDGKIKWVGDLNLNQDRKKASPVRFLAPFLTKGAVQDSVALNVIASNGKIYSFPFENGSLKSTPNVIQTIKEIEYSGSSCCGDLYLANNINIIFIERKAKSAE